MEVYRTEEEQVEALKDWWKENGRSVVIGAMIALAVVFGWRYWQDAARTQSESASELYQQMLGQLDSGDDRALLESSRHIVANHASSSYAALASLLLAQQAVEHGDLDGAAAHLRWVMENAKFEGLKPLAQLRLARVLLAQDKADDALQQLSGIADSGYQALVEEARGDAYLARGDRRQALMSYQTALLATANVPIKREILHMKIEDLADIEVAAQ